MRSAAEWATIRQGVLGAVPAAGSIDDRARSCLLEEFVRIVQEDALASPAIEPVRALDPDVITIRGAGGCVHRISKAQALVALGVNTPMREPSPMEQVLGAVQSELQVAMADFGPMHSAHEGYAVIEEELDELKAEVWKNQSKRDYRRMEREAIQVAAMAVRLILDVVKSPTRGQEKKALQDAVTMYRTVAPKAYSVEPTDRSLNNCMKDWPATPAAAEATTSFTVDDPPPSPAGAKYWLIEGKWVLVPDAPTPAVAQMNATNKAMDLLVKGAPTVVALIDAARRVNNAELRNLADAAASGLMAEFDALIKQAAPTTTYRPAPPGTPLEASVNAVETFRKYGLTGIAPLTCIYCGLDGCTGLSDTGRPVHAPTEWLNGVWKPNSGCVERAARS